MTGPFSRVPVGSRPRVVRASAAATLVLLVGVLLLGSPLRTDATPLGIVALQFATSPEAAGAILAAWEGVGRSRLIAAHGLDLLLPFAYATWIGTHAADVAVRAVRVAPTAAFAGGAAVVAAVADQVENVAMASTLLGGPAWGSVLVTLVAATVKFVTLTAALLALAATVLHARRPKGARP